MIIVIFQDMIYKGLVLPGGNYRYLRVLQGSIPSLVENQDCKTLELTITNDCKTSKDLGEVLGLEYYGDYEVPVTDDKAILLQKCVFSLNGLKFEKLTSDPHVLQIVIIEGTESRVIQDYDKTLIVVSKEDRENLEFIKFLFTSGNLQFIRPLGKIPAGWKLYNFPKILIKGKDLDLKSSSEEVFSLRRRYDDYVIRAIDYQDQAILELRKILEGYGLELVRQNKETSLKKTSYVTYQFSQTPTKINHPYYHDMENRVLSHRIPIDFTLHTTDMVMFFDFKNKYNNVDLLTNFCKYITLDKYGKKWTAAIRWGSITEDFNHQYQPDDNSNFSYQCNFRCEIFFYEIFDEHYSFLKEIINTLGNDII